MSYLAMAEEQYGLVTRAQLLADGSTRHTIQRLLAQGLIQPFLPGVYRIGGATPSWEQDVMGACLWAGDGACASHRSAGSLWGFPNVGPGSVEITTRRVLRSNRVEVHRGSIDEHEREERHGIPVTSAARTLIDLGTCLPLRQLEDAMDDALRRRLVTPSELRGLASRCRSGTRGLKNFKAALEHVDVRVINTSSVMESRLLRVLVRAGLPTPVPQYLVKDDSGFIARVDFAYPQAKLILEAESYRWHSTPRSQRRDIARENRLKTAGWNVIRVSWDEIRNPQRLIAQIRAALFPSLAD